MLRWLPPTLLTFTLCSCSLITDGGAGPCTITGDYSEEGYIKVPGGQVWYKKVGTNKNETPLLIIHGGPGITHEYLEPLEALACDRPVIFYDQLGSGNSDKPSDASLWTLERFVKEMDAVRNALFLKKVHILGQSWGTMLATEYIKKKGQNGIVSLVLSAPAISAGMWTHDARKYVEELPPEIKEKILSSEKSQNYSSPDYQQAIDYFYHKHVCRLEPWPDCLNRSCAKLNSDVYGKMWGPSEFTITGELKGFDNTNVLKNISLPVLFTAGEYDEATPETTQYYAGLTPGAKIIIYKDASHTHHLEKQSEYLADIRRFLLDADKAETP